MIQLAIKAQVEENRRQREEEEEFLKQQKELWEEEETERKRQISAREIVKFRERVQHLCIFIFFNRDPKL